MGRAQRSGWLAALVLTCARVALAPLMLAWLYNSEPRSWFAAALLAGFLTDVFDGVVARRFGAATDFLRRLDSGADILFYLAVAYSAWRLFPGAIRPLSLPILLVVGAETLNFAVSRVKFGREPSYHAWTARAWGLVLFVSMMTLFATGSARLLPAAIIVGLVAQAEVLAITLTLREWRHDVHSVWHVRRRSRASASGIA